MPITTPLSYTPLQQGHIRLLRLLPKNIRSASPFLSSISRIGPIDSISCALETVSFDEKPAYTALSYVWGDPTSIREVFVDNSQIEITENLYTALQHLRHDDEALILWVDALCINQADLAERSAQISQMRQIYQNAQSVVVFLGPEADGSDKVMESLEHIGRIAEETGLAGVTEEEILLAQKSSDDQFSQNLLAKMDQCHDRMDHWFFDEFLPNDYHTFSKRPWWYRVWVVQEFSVAENVVFVCGKKQLDHKLIKQATDVLSQYSWTTIRRVGVDERFMNEEIKRKYYFAKTIQASPAMNMMLSFRLMYQNENSGKDGEKRNLYQWLKMTSVYGDVSQRLKATDERDRIFGLLGLAADSNQLSISIDYTIPAEEVFTSASKAIIMTGELDVLAFRASPSSLRTVPSWAQDWNANLHAPFSDNKTIDRPFHAAGTSIPNLSFPDYPQKKTLRIEGIRIGTILNIGIIPEAESIATFTTEFSNTIDWLAVEEFVSSAEQIFSGHSEEDIARALIGDYCPVVHKDSAILKVVRATPSCVLGYRQQIIWLAITKEQSQIVELAKQGLTPDLAKRIEELTPKMEQFLGLNCFAAFWSALSISLSRRPFSLEGGYIGLGPRDMQACDFVSIFLGGDIPFVLRPLGNERYHLVGEAYVHKAMDGEFMHMKPKTEFFDIV